MEEVSDSVFIMSAMNTIWNRFDERNLRNHKLESTSETAFNHLQRSYALRFLSRTKYFLLNKRLVSVLISRFSYLDGRTLWQEAEY